MNIGKIISISELNVKILLEEENEILEKLRIYSLISMIELMNNFAIKEVTISHRIETIENTLERRI